METNRNTPSDFISTIANISAFIMLLAIGGQLSFTLPKATISESEKRELTRLPHFSWNNLFHGKFTDSLDLYYADNFPFRDSFVDAARAIKEKFGYRVNDLRLYTTETPPDVSVDSLNVLEEDTVTNRVVKVDSVKTEPKTPPENSVLIYKGAAFQVFRSSTEVAESYAVVMNSYRKALHDSIRIFCLVAPTPIDFYLPMEYKSLKNLEGPNIKALYAKLDSGVSRVDAYAEIESHREEYLYFNTDHHWTGRGAYYAYRAFSASAGIHPYELNQFNRRIRKKFLGSLFDITKDTRLKHNIDSIETFRLPIQAHTIRYKNPTLDSPMVFPLYLDVTNYLTFMGGDYPLVKIVAENEQTRRALVIKDSYGNAFCPFLALHYKEVFVVDYRYFEMNILRFISQNKIDDIIFVHNTFVANTAFTARKELYLMRSRKYPPELVKQDSVKTPGTE